ncbi:peptide deformylase [Corynebacterium cystitidis]|uniref:Peptide deformylase n=1 Tax=Corynebacterium cystitidis DSM 20524 TaxID=1121357 RepID=A0A1H9PIX6_9CORY|nr:peptide deformylase [Corynebacterium cystitidis]WJY82496.1 Peptide deformylase [Corynebacterium cystitidis DSM 20524]SER47513.1 peptide deformylase [Corynebacterium cystitidis DSM 20524]SNV75114.1 peptide deformylase [Corynebacterium cystitidis]
MTIREIRLFGDPVLTSRAREVTEFDGSLRTLIDDMLDTMDAAGGVGLAANQIGLLKRVFVYDCSHVEAGLRGAIINPVWQPWGDKMQVGPEGCLSIPDISAETQRHFSVVVRGQDVEGRAVALQASGLMARCIQHETDHLDGVLFLKRLEPEIRKEAMGLIRTADWFKEN